MDRSALKAGSPFPALGWRAVSGGRVCPAEESGWRALVVYRGKHCPLCEKYLATLDGLLDQFKESGIAVSVVSADPLEKAQAEAEQFGWKFPVGYDLSMDDMRTLGVFISNPRSPQETDRPFAEPAVFVVNPAGQTQIIDRSNAPFARPDLKSLLAGLEFVVAKDYPIRGTA